MWTGSHLGLKALVLDEESEELDSGGSVSSFVKWVLLQRLSHMSHETIGINDPV